MGGVMRGWQDEVRGVKGCRSRNCGMKETASNAKVAEHEQFLDTRLRNDLNDAASLRRALITEQDDYRALGQNLHLLLKVCGRNLPCLLHVHCVLDLNLHAGSNS